CWSSLRTAERIMSSSSTIRMRGIVRSRPFVRAVVAGIGIRLVSWQAQSHAGPQATCLIGRAFSLNVAIVFFNDAVHQRQAKARAFVRCLGGVERLENMIQLIRRDAGAFVNQLDDSGVAVIVSTDPDNPAIG